MKISVAKTLLPAAMLLGAASLAQAHASFVAVNAYAGKSYIATLNVPHGCSTGSAEDSNLMQYVTVKIEVSIPATFTSVRPQDSTFGTATVEKNESGAVTKLIWTKTAAALPADDHLYQVSFRDTLPADALQTLAFDTKQTCASDTSKTWEGADAPKLRVLPARAPGWNKYTAQAEISLDSIKSFFNDAYIVWSGGAGYSANPVTNNLIANKLTAIPLGAELWVKY